MDVRQGPTTLPMPQEMSEPLVEAFREEMAHRFGLHVTPAEASSVWSKLVLTQKRALEREMRGHDRQAS